MAGLGDLCARYGRRFRLRLVVLFGSRARGDYTEWSDFDVLVVADDLPGDPREAFSALYDPSTPSVVPIGIRTDKFLRMLREGSTLLLEALEDGRVLCGDAEFAERVFAIYREVRRGFERRGRLWVRVGDGRAQH